MSRKEIKDIAKANFKDHWGVLLLVFALTHVAFGFALVLGFGLGCFIVAGPLTAGVYYVYLRTIKSGDADWKDMFFAFRTMFPNSFAVEALTILIVGIPSVCAGYVISSLLVRSVMSALNGVVDGGVTMETGGILPALSFIIGAVIAIGVSILVIIILYGYAEAQFLLLKEPGIKPVSAMKKSRLMMQGNKGRLFIFELSFLGWFILCSLTIGLLLIYVVPYYLYARTMLLEQIYQERCGVSMDDDADMQKISALKDNVKAKTDSVAGKTRGKKAEHKPERDTLNVAEKPESAKGNVCKYCGARLPEGAAFCGKCGKQQ